MRCSVRVALVAGILLLAACGSKESEKSLREMEPVAVHTISGAALENLTYTLTNPLVRERLMASRRTFSVALHHGSAALLSVDREMKRVTILPELTAYGDLTGDGRDDAVVVLRVGGGEPGILELAIVTESGGGPMHLASFDLGRAEVKTLRVQNGKLAVSFMHQVPGDPGPRNTALTLEVPRSGTGMAKPNRMQ